ncbi:MAG: GNAT family N-acetyltransferase [Sulfitobacter sp.]
MHPDFDPQPILSDDILLLRPLRADDLDPLHTAASDPAIWAGHPVKNRHQRAVFEPYFATLLDTQATLAVTLRKTGQIIGCSRYYAAPDHANSVSIGYTFLAKDWWGGSTNLALKTLMLAHAFACVDTVWLHIGLDNIRSQKATAKLGAVHAYDGDIGLGGVPGMWQCWRLEKSVWTARLSA